MNSKAEIISRLTKASYDEWLCLFHIIAARELPRYAPAKKAYKDAKRELAKLWGDNQMVLSAVDLLSTAEAYVPNKGEANFIRQRAEELGRTPLIYELPEDLTFSLWRNCRGWHNALELAGLTPLGGDILLKAQTEYMISMSSPKLLDGRINGKLNDNEVRDLQYICDMAKRLGRAPSKAEIPKGMFHRINKLFGSWRVLLLGMGIPPLDPKTDRRISRAITRRK